VAFTTPNRQDQKRTSPKTLQLKHWAHQDKNMLKSAVGKEQVTYKGKPTRITADILTKTHKSKVSVEQCIPNAKIK
jgi:hypothetical protein